MQSWRKVGRLITLCEQRKNRVVSSLASLERARQENRDLERQLALQIDVVDALLSEQMEQGGVMDKAALFAARRHLAVLLSQKNDIRLERKEAQQHGETLDQQHSTERQRLLALEKKRNTYQTWMQGQRRLFNQHRILLEQSEIEERTQWAPQ